MFLLAATTIGLTDEEKDILRKADCLIADIADSIEKYPYMVDTILPHVIDSIKGNINKIEDYRKKVNKELDFNDEFTLAMEHRFGKIYKRNASGKYFLFSPDNGTLRIFNDLAGAVGYLDSYKVLESHASALSRNPW